MREKIRLYVNDNVVNDFLLKFNMERSEAEMIFSEMLNWIVYCSDERTVGYRVIDDATLIIDEMWHNFILFTKDYANFCEQYLGYFLHHFPTTLPEREKQSRRTKEEVLLYKKKQYELIFDVLGKEAFINWYHVFPEKYTKKYINEIRK